MTLRNDILDNIVERFDNIDVVLPTNTQKYKFVTREPMCEGMINALRPGEAAISLFEGEETNIQNNISTTTKDLTIVVELYYKTRPSDRDWKTRKISEKLNNLLAEVIKIVLSDRQCGNKSLNIYEVSNTLDVEGIYDDTVGLTATFSVHYRHALVDPTQRI